MRNKHINYKPKIFSQVSFKKFYRQTYQALEALGKTAIQGQKIVIMSSLQENFTKVVFNQNFPKSELVIMLMNICEDFSSELSLKILLSAAKQVDNKERYQIISSMINQLPDFFILNYLKILVTTEDSSLGKPLLSNQPEKYLPDAITFLSFLDVSRSSGLVAELKSKVPANRFRLLIKSLKNKNITDLGGLIQKHLKYKKESLNNKQHI